MAGLIRFVQSRYDESIRDNSCGRGRFLSASSSLPLESGRFLVVVSGTGVVSLRSALLPDVLSAVLAIK